MESDETIIDEALATISYKIEDVVKGEGNIKKISVYGSGVFLIFENGNTYKLSIEKYNSKICLDNK